MAINKFLNELGGGLQKFRDVSVVVEATDTVSANTSVVVASKNLASGEYFIPMLRVRQDNTYTNKHEWIIGDDSPSDGSVSGQVVANKNSETECIIQNHESDATVIQYVFYQVNV